MVNKVVIYHGRVDRVFVGLQECRVYTISINIELQNQRDMVYLLGVKFVQFAKFVRFKRDF